MSEQNELVRRALQDEQRIMEDEARQLDEELERRLKSNNPEEMQPAIDAINAYTRSVVAPLDPKSSEPSSTPPSDVQNAQNATPE